MAATQRIVRGLRDGLERGCNAAVSGGRGSRAWRGGCALNCGESPGFGRCDWEGDALPHLFIKRPWWLSRPQGTAASRIHHRPANADHGSAASFFGGTPSSLPTSGFSCPPAHYPSNFYTSVDGMLILIASCLCLFQRPTQPSSRQLPPSNSQGSSPSPHLPISPFLPLSARVTI
jgi:hypothetical protein